MTPPAIRPRNKRGRPSNPLARRERIVVLATADDVAAWQIAAGDQPIGTWLWRLANRSLKRTK